MYVTDNEQGVTMKIIYEFDTNTLDEFGKCELYCIQMANTMGIALWNLVYGDVLDLSPDQKEKLTCMLEDYDIDVNQACM